MSYERRRREKLQDRILFSSCKAYLATWQNIMFLGPMGTLALWWDIIGDGAVQISDSYLGNARLAGPEVKVEIRMEQISQSGLQGRFGRVVLCYTLLSCVTLCSNCQAGFLINCFSLRHIKIHNADTKNYFILINHWKIIFHSMEIKFIWKFSK